MHVLNAVVVLVCVFICWRAGVSEQEAATVAAAEADPAPEAPAGTAADSEPEEPKDTETEESVS